MERQRLVEMRILHKACDHRYRVSGLPLTTIVKLERRRSANTPHPYIATSVALAGYARVSAGDEPLECGLRREWL